MACVQRAHISLVFQVAILSSYRNSGITLCSVENQLIHPWFRPTPPSMHFLFLICIKNKEHSMAKIHGTSHKGPYPVTFHTSSVQCLHVPSTHRAPQTHITLVLVLVRPSMLYVATTPFEVKAYFGTKLR